MKNVQIALLFSSTGKEMTKSPTEGSEGEWEEGIKH